MTDSNAPSAIPAAVADSLIGKEIDGCAIVKKIGQGGMGIVYLAEHTKLRQQYVVKILNPALVAAEDTVQRFFREAQSVARLNHPAIVSIQNVGQEGDYYYIRMEYVDGDTVENIIKQEKKLDWKLATKIVLDTADALSHAHKKGIIHRDIKPENIMFTTNGQVKVMDFGLAKQVQAATKVSVTGQIVGTPFFMSPEQAGGKTTDARSDIYSLGVTYYYLLTGVKPFNGKNLQEIFLKHFFYTPESPKIYTPDLPEPICEIIRRCLKKKKKERYQSAAELARDLRVALGQEPGASPGDSVVPDYKDDEDAAAPRPMNNGGGLAATGSDPAIPVAASPDSSDLAAARAELGGEDESNTVQVSSRTRRSIIEPVPDADAPGMPAEPPPVAPGEQAAPVQKRGRVQLEQVAGASLVFAPKSPTDTPATTGAPAPELPPGEVAAPVARRERTSLDGVAAASLVFTKKNPTDIVPEPAVEAAPGPLDSGEGEVPIIPALQKPGSSTMTVGTAKKVTLGHPSRVKPAPLVAGALIIVLGGGFGTIELGGRSKCGVLERRYSELQKAEPPSDAAGWATRSENYQKLALALDDFTQSVFGRSSKGAMAAQLANSCREAATNAERARNQILIDPNLKPGEVAEAARRREEARDAVSEVHKQIDELVAKKQFKKASDLAIETWDKYFIKSNVSLGKPYEQLVYVPVEVSVAPPSAKVYGADGALLGETPANGSSLVLRARPFATLKLEIRHPHFVSQSWEKSIEGYDHVDLTLEREARPPVSLGTTQLKYPCFKFANVTEPVFVDAPFEVDRQAGTIVMVTRQGNVRCVDCKTGHFAWDPVAIADYGDPSGGPEVLAGRAIFTAGCDGVVRALDAQTGAIVWKQALGAPVRVRPCLTTDGSAIVVGTLNGDIVLLDSLGDGQGGGKILWSVPAESAIDARPATRGNVVYAASRDGKLRSIDRTSGKQLSLYDAQDAICAGPVLAGDRIYIGTRSGRVHALAVQDPGKAVFVTDAAGAPILDIAVAGEVAYYATTNELRAVSTKAGAQVFAPYQPGAPIAGFDLMTNRVALCTTGGIVTALDGQSGEVAWWFALKGVKGEPMTVGAPPVVVGEDLYVVTREGVLIDITAD